MKKIIGLITEEYGGSNQSEEEEDPGSPYNQ